LWKAARNFTTEVADGRRLFCHPWHFMMRAAVSHARDPHCVGASTAEFPNFELALLAEVLRCAMQRDVLRTRVWAAKYIDEEERWVLVECLEQQELQMAIASAYAMTSTVTVARRVLIHLAFPDPG
jgi:hypothetical protein